MDLLRGDKKEKVLIYSIIGFGIIIRIIFAIIHFTHIDDVGLIITCLPTIKNEFALNLAKSWTYGPFQMFLTNILVNENFHYLTNVFLGRLPSLICGILVLFLVLKLVYNTIHQEEYRCLKVLGLCVVTFSWENIIYSAQAEPYEIVVLFSFVIINCLYNDYFRTWETTLVITLILLIGCYAHYQFFILVFCFYSAYFIFSLKNKKKLIKIVASAIICFILILPLLYFVIKNNKLNAGINWNIGINSSFLFNTEKIFSPGGMTYLFSFFIKNLFLIIKYFYTIDILNNFSNFIAFVFFVSAIIGLFDFHKNNKMIAVFIDIVLLLTIILTILGKLTFGPSRHSLFLYALLYSLILHGIMLMMKKMFYQTKIAIKILNFAFILLFILSIPSEISSRKNYLSEDKIDSLVRAYSPDIIYGYCWTADLQLMNINNYNYNFKNWNSFLTKETNEVTSSKTVMLISRTSDFNGFMAQKKSFDDFTEQYGYCLNFKSGISLLYQEKIYSCAEVEYSSQYYSNFPNGLIISIYEVKVEIPILDSERIIFYGEKYNAKKFIKYGFSSPESDFTWTNDKKAEIIFLLNAAQSDLECTLEYLTFDGNQRVMFYVNGQMIADYVSNGESKKSFIIPKESIGKDGILQLLFELPNAHSPASMGLSNDTRELALAFKSLVIIEKQ